MLCFSFSNDNSVLIFQKIMTYFFSLAFILVPNWHYLLLLLFCTQQQHVFLSLHFIYFCFFTTGFEQYDYDIRVVFYILLILGVYSLLRFCGFIIFIKFRIFSVIFSTCFLSFLSSPLGTANTPTDQGATLLNIISQCL